MADRASSGVNPIKQKLKRLFYKLLGKDPEAVVVTFLSGDPERARKMFDEVRSLVPDRRHFAVAPLGTEMENAVPFQSYGELRRAFRHLRIGLTPVLFDNDPRYRSMRFAAFRLAPRRILAYNGRLERHHLRWRTMLASWLFLRGVPLDRIFLRPRWLYPLKRDRSVVPDSYEIVEGRPLSLERPKVAVLTPYFPYPLSHGGAVRIFHLLREASREFDIFLFAFTRKETTADLAPVLEFCAKAILTPAPRYREPRWASLEPPEVREFLSPRMAALLEQVRREAAIGLLQIEYTQLAKYGGDVLVEHDVTFDLFEQIHARERSLSSWWNLRRWRRFERGVVRNARSVVAMSIKDARLLGTGNVRVIGNGVDLDRFRPVPETPGARILFIGSFRHFPNVLAFRFFMQDVWPRLRERFPRATVRVVAGPEPHLFWREYAGSREFPSDRRIRVEGFVADVLPLYAEANVVIVPTTVSAGTNLKVLEAMAMERAVVSTPSGCAGLALEHGRDVWIGESADEFAQGVQRLLEDDALRSKLAKAARAQAERFYGWSWLGELQIDLWRDLLGITTVRQATLADVAHIERIQSQTNESSQWEAARYLDYHCQVAVCGGRVTGFLVSRQAGGGEREILNLAVALEHRRRGVAGALLRNELRTWGGAFFLEVRESNYPAQNLYKKLGFVEVGRRPEYYDHPSETAIVMRWQSC